MSTDQTVDIWGYGLRNTAESQSIPRARLRAGWAEARRDLTVIPRSIP